VKLAELTTILEGLHIYMTGIGLSPRWSQLISEYQGIGGITDFFRMMSTPIRMGQIF